MTAEQIYNSLTSLINKHLSGVSFSSGEPAVPNDYVLTQVYNESQDSWIDAFVHKSQNELSEREQITLQKIIDTKSIVVNEVDINGRFDIGNNKSYKAELQLTGPILSVIQENANIELTNKCTGDVYDKYVDIKALSIGNSKHRLKDPFYFKSKSVLRLPIMDINDANYDIGLYYVAKDCTMKSVSVSYIQMIPPIMFCTVTDDLAIRGVTSITDSNDILPLPDWAYEEIIFGAASSYLQGYSGLLAPSTNAIQNTKEDNEQKGYRPERKESK